MHFLAFNLEKFTPDRFFYTGTARGARDKYEVWCARGWHSLLPSSPLPQVGSLILGPRFHLTLLLQCGWHDQFEWLHGWWHHNGHQVGIIGAPPLSFVIIRDKFSASNYWKDCVKYKVCRIGLRVKNVLPLKGDCSPIHWRDLPLPDKLSPLPWRKYPSSQTDVWQWFEAWHLDPVCLQVMPKYG